MTNPFEKTENWIETGPDGHHFYVRKKDPQRLPSFKAIFREAAHDLWHGPSPFWKSFKKANKKRSRSNPSTSSPGTIVPYPYNVSQSNLLLPNMSQQDSSNNNQPRGILKPEPQRFPSGPQGGPPLAGWPPMPQHPAQAYPFAYPGMGPMQPYTGYPSQMGYNYGALPMQTAINPHLSNASLPPGPTQPPGGFQGAPLPYGARAISPPRYPSQDDLRYKCVICGKFRSARYHYQHPLAPGQLPGTTICGRCRDIATYSEDESFDSEDSLGERRYIRRGSRRSHRAPSRRARSRGSDYRPSSRVRSLSRTSSVEEVQYVRRPRSRSTARRVVYVEEDEEPGYLSSGEHDRVEVTT